MAGRQPEPCVHWPGQTRPLTVASDQNGAGRRGQGSAKGVYACLCPHICSSRSSSSQDTHSLTWKVPAVSGCPPPRPLPG